MAEDQPPVPPKAVRGEGKLAWLSLRRDGELIEYEHEYGVPIDDKLKNAQKFIHYVGMLAKDGENFPFDKPRWKEIDNVKDKINEAREDLKSVFHFHKESETWFLRTLNARWRQNKYKKKKKYFDRYTTEEEWYAHCPPRVKESQWHNMVDYWRTLDYKKLSDTNTKNKKTQKIHHNAGSKSYLNHGAEIKKKTKKKATRVDIFKKTHRLNPLAAEKISEMDELKRKAIEDGICTEEDGLQVEGDIFSQVMELGKRKKILGVGIGVTTSTFKGGSSTNVNQEDVHMLREEVSLLREERATMLREREKDREELKMELQREIQKNREEMQKSVQVMIQLLVNNTTSENISPSISDLNTLHHQFRL